MVLAHVVPAHLIHARLKDALIVLVEVPRDQPGHAHLVDIHCGRVRIVEDLGVAQVVVGGAEEGLLVLEGLEEHLCQRPRVVKVVAQALARDCREVWQGL